MKVLLIDVNCKFSSTGKIIYELYDGINQSGNVAAIAYGRGPKVKGKNIFKFGLDFETYIHAFLARVTGLNGFFSPLSTLRLIRYIKKFNPDVVHLHELHAYFVNHGTIVNYLKVNKINTIWTFHCEYMYTGKCGHANNCEKFKVECHHCPQLNKYPSTYILDFTRFMYKMKKKSLEDFNNVIFVTPSNWLEKRVKLSFLKNKKVQTINNGIDTSIFFPRDNDDFRKILRIESDTKIVLSVAPNIFSDEKGGFHILEVAKNFQSKNVKFILIGANRIPQHKLSNTIILGSIKDQELLSKYYSVADVFLICSKRENYPTTCLEAQCCGTTICGYDSGGTKETSIEKNHEKFVDYGNINGLVSIIDKQLMKSFESANNLSKIAAKKFDRINMLKEYSELYKSTY